MSKPYPPQVAIALAVFLASSPFLIACNSGGSSGGETGGTGGTRPFCESDQECDDERECTANVCDMTSGMCEFSALADGTACEEGQGVCRNGQCLPTELKAFVEPPNPQPDARFGTSVAIFGDRMLVGSPTLMSGSGSVAVYDNDGLDWLLTESLPASQPADGLFGWSVALAGVAPLAGSAGGPLRGLGGGSSATGSVRVYNTMGAFRRLEASDVAGTGLPYQLYSFGGAIDFSETTMVVGAPTHFGATIHLDEATQVVGTAADSMEEAPTYSGAVYVFTSVTGLGIEQAFLKASNAESTYACDTETGQTTGIGDSFGAAVAISGNTIAVGAPAEASAATGIDGNQDDNSAPEAGAVYIFERNEGAWAQTAYIKASNTDAGDRFGFAVSLDGDTLVVGAEREDSAATEVDGDEDDNSAEEAGAVYVFERSEGAWAQTAYLKPSNGEAGVFFGANVSVDVDTILIGAPGESSVGGENSGAAYVFSRDADSWTQTNFLKAFNAEPGSGFAGPPGILTLADNFLTNCQLQSVAAGVSIDVYGTTMLVGAPFLDSMAGADSGGVYIFENE